MKHIGNYNLNKSNECITRKGIGIGHCRLRKYVKILKIVEGEELRFYELLDEVPTPHHLLQVKGGIIDLRGRYSNNPIKVYNITR